MRTVLIILALLVGSSALAAVSPAAGAASSPAHIAVIVEENRNRNQVIGASDMPYFNGLATQFSSFSGWDGVAHPSEPNYIALIAGSTLGVADDGHYDFGNVNNLGAQLTAAGISWKAYMEGLPSVGYMGDTSGEYARKHNPFADFNGNAANFVPATQYAQDLAAGTLPAFIFYVPNLLNDGHDAANPTVDASLKSILEPLRASAWYTQGGGSIIVTYDEDEGQGVIAQVVISQNAQGHASYAGNHYGTLRTIEEAYHLPLLGAAASGTSFGAILGGAAATPAPAPAPTPTPTPTPTPSPLPPPGAGPAITFTPRNGNAWWVQVGLSGADAASVVSVDARPAGGTWHPLVHQSYGDWAASFYVGTAHVDFRATLLDGRVATTLPASTFAATFTNMRGNAWWVEANVAVTGGTLSGVDASVNGGAWIPLAATAWGSWAKSINAPAGSQVRFRADAVGGATVVSAPKTW